MNKDFQEMLEKADGILKEDKSQRVEKEVARNMEPEENEKGVVGSFVDIINKDTDERLTEATEEKHEADSDDKSDADVNENLDSVLSMVSNIFKSVDTGVESDLRNQEAGVETIKENIEDLHHILKLQVEHSKASEEEKKELMERVDKLCYTETNIMLVGATGCGKSSTINALFTIGADDAYIDEDEAESGIGRARKKLTIPEVAKVGTKSDPETRDIEKYTLGKLVLWDTPGLGDGTEIDKHHADVIRELLREKNEDGEPLIDLVLVIMDGSTRDLGTSYKIINEVIVPELGEETNRMLVALNQADIAMKTGRHWNYETQEPDEILENFLKEKVESIKKRIKEDSGLDVNPVYYCAGYEEEYDVVYPYNLSCLLYYIMESLPSIKRVPVIENVNTKSENFKHNDDDKDYNEGIKEKFYDSFDYISDGVDSGVELGKTILGIPGAIIGAFLGGFAGCVRSILDDIFE